jgi:hypothetical protein
MREHSGTSLAIGILIALVYTVWGAVLAVLVWTGVTVYAIVKWIGAPSDHPSATTLLVMIVGLVTIVPLGLALGIYVIGRSMRPPKRPKELPTERPKELKDRAELA